MACTVSSYVSFFADRDLACGERQTHRAIKSTKAVDIA